MNGCCVRISEKRTHCFRLNESNRLSIFFQHEIVRMPNGAHILAMVFPALVVFVQCAMLQGEKEEEEGEEEEEAEDLTAFRTRQANGPPPAIVCVAWFLCDAGVSPRKERRKR